MTIRRFKECRHCGRQEPRGWTESADYLCIHCANVLTMAAAKDEQALRKLADDLDRAIDISVRDRRNRDRHLRQTIAAHLAKKEAEKARPGYTPDALRSDPTRRALRNQGDDLDPLNPLSLTSPLNPAHQDWDSSSHRTHSTSSHHSSHDDGGSYDSGSSDSGSSSGGCD